ncbi:radical SAM protein, partial [Candidatus Entotheonella serta]
DEVLNGFDDVALTYRWTHPDPRVDRLCDEALSLVQSGEAGGVSRRDIFMCLWSAAHKMAECPVAPLPEPIEAPARGPVPYLSEPWYC